MNWLLTTRKYNYSGRILATKLGLKNTSQHTKIPDGHLKIRYGNSSGSFTKDTFFNTPEVIRLCGNSVKFSDFCKEHEVNSPVYTPLVDIVDYEFPFLIRQKSHRSGKDIIVANGNEDIPANKTGLYHVPLFRSDIEIGVHYVNGKIIRIFRKDKHDDTAHQLIRTASFGYHYHLVTDLDNNFTVAQELVLKVAKLLKLGFGRFDIGYNSETKRYIIFEVNTAPGLNANSSELYAKELRTVLSDEGTDYEKLYSPKES